MADDNKSRATRKDFRAKVFFIKVYWFDVLLKIHFDLFLHTLVYMIGRTELGVVWPHTRENHRENLCLNATSSEFQMQHV